MGKIAKKEIVLLTGSNRFFGQTRKPWVSMNTELIASGMREKGFSVREFTIADQVNKPQLLENEVIFYTFSQVGNVRDYLTDLMIVLNKNNFLVPSLDLLLCHENKGYQEVLKSNLNIHDLKSFYFSSVDEAADYDIAFPAVLKFPEGSNGKFVFLVNSMDELRKKISQINRQSIFVKADLLRRKFVRGRRTSSQKNFDKKKDYQLYKEYIRKEKRYIIQEYIPALKYDYRVLIIDDHYFVMKRFTKEDDFKASGTKIQDYNPQLPKELLSYSKSIYSKFDTPFISLDIAEKNGCFYLLEFQALHFGLNVVVRTGGYFVQNSGEWEFVRNENVIEEEIVYGLSSFLNKKLKLREA